MKEIKILSPTAILGYGFPAESFWLGMEAKPDVIAVDAGSTDPGPYYLGSGKSFTDRNAVKRDLEYLIKAGLEARIPVIIGSAGGAGANEHLQWCQDIIYEIALEKGYRFNLAVIPAELDKPLVKKWYEAGRVVVGAEEPPLDGAEIESAERIVTQMGHEPLVVALEKGAQVILAGRAYDPSAFAAYAIWKGMDIALALHLGKILECAAIAADPGSGRDVMLGILGPDYFQVEPTNPARKCTPVSVAAHTLYEKTNPLHLPGPGGYLDLSGTTFQAVSDRRVEVRGTKYVPTKDYYLKLEGARKIGYRAISIAGIRDPIMIGQIDEILENIKEQVADNFAQSLGKEDHHLIFRLYGKDGVMGDLEPEEYSGHELGLIIETIAKTQEEADTICSFARSTLLHYGYPGRIATAGNLAFPYSPSDFSGGPVYLFNVYHLVKVDDPLGLFPVELIEDYPSEGGRKL